MKEVGKALGYILRNTSAITDVVDESYFVKLPQENSSVIKSDKTAVRFTIADLSPMTPKAEQATVDTYEVIMDVFAKNGVDASTAAEVIRNNLDKYKGDVNGVAVREITYEGGEIEADKLYEVDVVNCMMVFKVTINRTVNTAVSFDEDIIVFA